MALVAEGLIARVYTVSTSARAPSNIDGTAGTPTGLHAVAAKIGAGAPAGMVFKGRRPTGHPYPAYTGAAAAGNLITSRILRLRGLEPGRNAGPGRDSFDRYIYIHGTNHEERVGQPFSGGCVELTNADVIDLFERVAEGDHVWIGW